MGQHLQPGDPIAVINVPADLRSWLRSGDHGVVVTFDALGQRAEVDFPQHGRRAALSTVWPTPTRPVLARRLPTRLPPHAAPTTRAASAPAWKAPAPARPAPTPRPVPVGQALVPDGSLIAYRVLPPEEVDPTLAAQIFAAVDRHAACLKLTKRVAVHLVSQAEGRGARIEGPPECHAWYCPTRDASAHEVFFVLDNQHPDHEIKRLGHRPVSGLLWTVAHEMHHAAVNEQGAARCHGYLEEEAADRYAASSAEVQFWSDRRAQGLG